MKRKTQKGEFVVGIDEAGRGPLAGPVALGAVLMSKSNYSKFNRLKIRKELHNSKALSEKQRDIWYERIINWQKEGMLDFVYTSATAKVIDAKGISPSIRKCLNRALKKLEAPTDTKVLLDGSLHAPEEYTDQHTIIKGDEKEAIISLASIVAKVRRDMYMKKIAKKYPEYGLEVHKGYGTLVHRKAIRKYGLSDMHRESFCGNIKRKTP